jgi:pimeloyl-ACP methyl ester carboxylesterase
MAYLDFGDPGRPPDVVFVHGNSFNALAYRAILAPLAERMRILAVDLRGHGASTLPTDRPGRLDWYDHRDDLMAFLGALRLPPVVLAGHSMGATTCLLTAAVAPDSVRALALFDPVVLSTSAIEARGKAPLYETHLARGALKRRRTFASRQAAFEAWRGQGAFRTWPDEMLEDYVAAGFKDQPDGTVTLACTPEWEVSNYACQAHDSWAAFEAVHCPIHILRAAKDSPADLDEGLGPWLASGRVRMETIAGTTHFLPMERPELVRQVIGEAVG